MAVSVTHLKSGDLLYLVLSVTFYDKKFTTSMTKKKNLAILNLWMIEFQHLEQ